MRANPRISANYVDGMMAQRRVHDAQVKGLLTFAEESSRLSAAARNEQKLVDKRRAAQMNSVQAEMRMDQMIAEQERKSAMDVRISSQNQKLAVELERRKADAERKQVRFSPSPCKPARALAHPAPSPFPSPLCSARCSAFARRARTSKT